MRIAVATAVLALSTSIAAAQAPGQTMSWDPEEPPAARFAPPAPAPMPVEQVTVSYRGQIMAADAASLGLMVLGPLVSHDAELSGVGFTGFFVAAPLVHLAHGRGVAAAESFGLRTALPFIGLMAGYRLGPRDTACIETANVDGSPARGGGCSDHGSIIGMLVGAAAGGVTAMYVDARYLSHYETTRPATWSAGISPTRGGVSLAVSGAF